MKILMVTPYVPYPPASGGQIRTLNLLKYLSKKHYIVLVCLSKNEKDKSHIDHLKNFCDEVYICKRPEKPWMIKNVLKSLFSFQPFLIVRNFSDEARKTISHLISYETFDVIHCETFYVMPHIPPTKSPVMLVEQTIEFLVYKHFVDSLFFLIRLPFYLDILKLRYWERYYWKKAALIATVSEEDRQIVLKQDPALSPIVVPNGAGEDMLLSSLPKKDTSKKNLLFLGNFAWLQNKEAAEYLLKHIYPELIKQIPEINVVIAGQNASFLPGSKNISIINIDPQDVDKVKRIYSESFLFIAPIFGPGGTRLKILAAMASGLPVISTPTGVNGLELVPESNVLIAETPQQFISQIARVIKDEKLYDNLRKNAFDTIHKKYNWKSIAKNLEAAYLTIKK